MKNISEKKYIIALLSFSFSIFMIYSFIIPFNKAPDEMLRFDLVDFMRKYKELPIGGDSRLYYGDYGVTYAFKPYIAYMFGAMLCMISEFFNLNIPYYLVARFFSVLCGVVTIYFTYLICKKLFSKSKIKYIIPFMIATIPQFIFLNSYVNQDAFMIMLSSIIIYLWIKGIELNWNWSIVIKVGLLCGLMMLSYINGYVIIVSTLIIVLLTYKSKDKVFIQKTIICILIILLISGWFFVRNLIIYNGEIFGASIARAISEELAIPSLKPSLRDIPYKDGINEITILYKTDWIKKTFLSFWAMLGNMDIRLNVTYYLLMMVACSVAFVGIGKKVLEFKKQKFYNENIALYLIFSITIIMTLAMSLIYSVRSDFQPQGRYLYASILPIMILGFKGVETLVETCMYKNIIYLVIFIGWSFLNLTLPIIAMLDKFYFLV